MGEYAEVDLTELKRVFIQTLEFGEISIMEDKRGIHINVGSNQMMILPKADSTVVLQNSRRTE